MIIHDAVMPPPLPESRFGYGKVLPPMRAAELPGMASVRVRDLFSDVPAAIHTAGQDVAPVREAAREALSDADMSMIQPGDTVNVLCSEHGFAMMGGDAYAELIKTIKDVVEERTGCRKIRLALSTAMNKNEVSEIVPRFGLNDHFAGKVFNFGPFDPGVAIDTEIGRLYGVKRAYNSRWIIHVHYDDPREIHFHRVNGRTLKSFTMSYARMETRSIFHNNFPTRSANIVPRAIYESPFIQKKWAFAAVLTTSPDGVTGIGADNDLIALDRRVSASTLRSYGKLIQLFRSIDACFAVADDTRWVLYQHAGGLTSCTLYHGVHDHLDLDLVSIPTAANPAVKLLVVNYAWKLAATGFLTNIAATPAVGRDLERIDPMGAIVADGLEDAMEKAYELAGTEKAIVFDGSYGSINLTRPLAEDLIARAPAVSRRVDEELLPKWLAQRKLNLVG
jgi:hypothetical protein